MHTISFNKVRTRATSFIAIGVLAGSSLAAPFLVGGAAFADSTVVVNPSNAASLGWTTDDTRANGHVSFVGDSSAPLGQGALSLKTDASPTAGQDKAQFDHYLATPVTLSSITGALGYQTKQNSASFSAGDPAYQIFVYMKGTDNGNDFNTLTYEPYVDQGNDAVQTGVWQNWSISQSSSKFYSSHNYSGQNGSVTASQGSSTYTLNDIMTAFPNAQVIGYGVNVGSNNPGYDTEADAFNFNGTTYDFEPAAPGVPTNLRFEDNPTIACGGATKVNFTHPTWDAVNGAVSYDYHVDGPNSLSYDTNTTNTSVSGSFGSGSEGTYTFKVRSVDASGVKSAYSDGCSITYDATAPNAPKLVSPTNHSVIHRHTFNFTWHVPKNDTGSALTYTFEAATDKNFTQNVVTHTGLTHTALASPNTPNGTYFWRVRATDAAGNQGPWSSVNKFRVNVKQLAAPELQSPDKNATLRNSTFTFKWNTVNNPNGGGVTYQWQSSLTNAVNADGGFTNVLGDHTGSGHTLASPNTPNNTYYWHVRAIDAEGNLGKWSPVWKFTVNAH